MQLPALGFSHPEFQGEIRGELDWLRDNGLVRVIDALAVPKDADGNVKTLDDASSATTSRPRSAPLLAGWTDVLPSVGQVATGKQVAPVVAAFAGLR